MITTRAISFVTMGHGWLIGVRQDYFADFGKKTVCACPSTG